MYIRTYIITITIIIITIITNCICARMPCSTSACPSRPTTTGWRPLPRSKQIIMHMVIVTIIYNVYNYTYVCMYV